MILLELQYDQSKNGPPDWSEKSSSACSSSQVTSFGRRQTHKRKAMSFESYVTAKPHLNFAQQKKPPRKMTTRK